MFGSTNCNIEIIDLAPGIEIKKDGVRVGLYNYCQLSAKLKYVGDLTSADPDNPLKLHGVTITSPHGPIVIDDPATCLLDPANTGPEDALSKLDFLITNCGAEPVDDTPPPEIEATGLRYVCPADPLAPGFFVNAVYDEVAGTWTYTRASDGSAVVPDTDFTLCQDIEYQTVCWNSGEVLQFVAISDKMVVGSVIFDAVNQVTLPALPSDAARCTDEHLISCTDYTDDPEDCSTQTTQGINFLTC